MYKAYLGSRTFWVFTGIPECFLGNWLDPRRDVWDKAVEELLWSIPNVSEIGCYGEYSIHLIYTEDVEPPENVVAYVQSFVNSFKPPFDYERGSS